MKDKLKKYRISIIFAIAGAIGGFLYWRFVGCLSGTCPIKSVWYWTTLWGTAAGYLVGDMIREFLEKREKKRNERTV
ncbi:MAG: DUF6132 family protein [Bacteroidota bacterium]